MTKSMGGNIDSAPEVTVAMPLYNAARTVDATIRSVLAQSVAAFELVIIDDGSTDDSLARAMVHASSDARIRLVSRANGGVSSARNQAASLGSAPLIAFIDADDLWDEGKLARHMTFHRDAPGQAASYARIAFIGDDAAGLDGAKTVSSLCAWALRLVDVLGENPVCTASNFVVQRSWFESVGGFNESLSFAEDQELVARIVQAGGLIGGIDAVLTGYRFSPDGLSMDLERMHDGWRSVAMQFAARDELAALEALYCRYLARRVLRAGGRPRMAMHYALAGLQLDAAAFLRDRRRGFATLLAAFFAQFLPGPVRQRLFA
jgi:glycosyltransferase involved in cell wall biosynthesis